MAFAAVAVMVSAWGGLPAVPSALAQAPGAAPKVAPPNPTLPAPPPAGSADSGSADPDACNPRDRTVASPEGDGPRPPGGRASQDSSNLSERLGRTGGVICPPAGVDPDIRAPAPGGGVTPVIPPPGTPGGDPSVRPK